jgi:hypothetical protein
MEPTADRLVGGPQLVPQLGAGVVGLGGHAGRRERAIRPAAAGGQCRDERGALVQALAGLVFFCARICHLAGGGPALTGTSLESGEPVACRGR